MRPVNIFLIIPIVVGILIFSAGIGVLASNQYSDYNPSTVTGLMAIGALLVFAAFLGFCVPRVYGARTKGGARTGQSTNGPYVVNNDYVDNSGFWPGVTAQNNADYNAWQAANNMQTLNSIYNAT